MKITKVSKDQLHSYRCEVCQRQGTVNVIEIDTEFDSTILFPEEKGCYTNWFFSCSDTCTEFFLLKVS